MARARKQDTRDEPEQEIEETPEQERAAKLAFIRELSVPELSEVIRLAQAERHEKVQAEKQEIIERLRAQMEDYEISKEEMFGSTAPRRGRPPGGGAPSTGARKSPVAKYRSPDGRDEWSGRGRMATWLKAELASGKKLEDFLIDKEGQRAADKSEAA